MSRSPAHPIAARGGRRLATALLALLALGAAMATPAAAQPSAAYRFWGYFQQVDGEWQFAQTGADATNPADGSVEGWRFATAGPTDTRTPRATPTFEEVCADTDAADGQKRVAVVVDYGRDVDGPDGAEPPQPRAACAVVPEAATGNDVLAAVVDDIRSEEGLTCALDGYPATGCGDAVDPMPEAAQAPDEPVELAGLAAPASASPTAAATDAATDDGDAAAQPSQPADDGAEESRTGLWVTVAAVLLVAMLGAGALLRRRRSSD